MYKRLYWKPKGDRDSAMLVSFQGHVDTAVQLLTSLRGTGILNVAGMSIPVHDELVPFKDISFTTALVMSIINDLLNPDKPRKNFTRLTDYIKRHFTNTRPGQSESMLKKYMQQHIQNVAKSLFRRKGKPEPQLVLFGSLACGLDSAGGDIDLGIKLHDRPNKRYEKVCLTRLMNRLEIHECHGPDGSYHLKILPILDAKVPILKIHDPQYNLHADISIWRDQGIVAELIKDFCRLDKRVQPLLIAIKHWSKQRRINDASTGKLNSFGYVILALKFLQLCGVVPLEGKKMQSKSWKSKTKADLGELLCGFFKFYANFPFYHYQITLLRQGLEKMNQAMFDIRTDQTVVIIQDPIETENNVARNVREYTLQWIKEEFRRAYALTTENKWDKLIEKKLLKRRAWGSGGKWKRGQVMTRPSHFLGQFNNFHRPNRFNRNRKRLRD